MKIQLKNDENKVIFEGNSQYLEGGTTDEKPSFHIELKGLSGIHELFFFMKSIDELDELISDLKELRDDISKK